MWGRNNMGSNFANLIILISYRANGLPKLGPSHCILEDLDRCSGDPVGILRECG